MKVTDMLKIRQVGAITLSPDGSKAVFSVTAIEPDSDARWEYKYVNQLYLVPVDGSAAPRLLSSF